MTKSNLKGQEIILANNPPFHSIIERVRARTQAGQELMHRPLGRAADWFALNGWLSLLPYSAQDCQSRGGTAHSDLDPPTSLNSQVNEAQACPQAHLLRVFSQLRSFCSSLCQGDRKLAITIPEVLVHNVIN